LCSRGLVVAKNDKGKWFIQLNSLTEYIRSLK
jgi:hypothetical protein